jgi:hypothetical protein
MHVGDGVDNLKDSDVTEGEALQNEYTVTLLLN